MLFRQLFEPVTSTCTYLIADEVSREAALIDPVAEEVPRYERLLAELGLRLVYTLETHVHADHVTGAALLRDHLGSRSVAHRDAGAACADVLVDEGDALHLGAVRIDVLATPGHTAACVSYRVGDRVLTGDALLIGATGRTDFQGGDAGRLYDAITTRLFSLPDDTLVYPGHDYQGDRVSTIGREKARNARAGQGRSRTEFITILDALALPYPKLMDRAVPANRACGSEVGHG